MDYSPHAGVEGDTVLKGGTREPPRRPALQVRSLLHDNHLQESSSLAHYMDDSNICLLL